MTVGFGTLVGSSLRFRQFRANRRPTFVLYFRPRDATMAEHTAFVINVLRIQGDRIVEVTGFDPKFLPAFGFPMAI